MSADHPHAPACASEASAQRVLDDLKLEVARVEARYDRRYPPGYVCPKTGEPSWVALGLGPTSIAYRVGATEGHHPHSGHVGVIFYGPTAVNRIAKEAERIAEAIGLFDAGLCIRYVFGFGVLLGILLARIGIVP
jgi:hypothetical protein